MIKSVINVTLTVGLERKMPGPEWSLPSPPPSLGQEGPMPNHFTHILFPSFLSLLQLFFLFFFFFFLLLFSLFKSPRPQANLGGPDPPDVLGVNPLSAPGYILNISFYSLLKPILGRNIFSPISLRELICLYFSGFIQSCQIL